MAEKNLGISSTTQLDPTYILLQGKKPKNSFDLIIFMDPLT